jgi:hypothetical protein
MVTADACDDNRCTRWFDDVGARDTWLRHRGDHVVITSRSRTVGAQEVRGTVLRADSITPASGIVMLLLRETGNATVSRTVTGERGTYVLRAPGVGRYRLRVLRLGHQPMTLGPIALSSGEVRTVPVRLIDAPIQLAQFEVRSASQCRVRPDSGLLVAQLYEEARKALLASVSATSGVESLADYEMFSRLVDRRNRVIAPVQITALARPTTRPFPAFLPIRWPASVTSPSRRTVVYRARMPRSCCRRLLGKLLSKRCGRVTVRRRSASRLPIAASHQWWTFAAMWLIEPRRHCSRSVHVRTVVEEFARRRWRCRGVHPDRHRFLVCESVEHPHASHCDAARPRQLAIARVRRRQCWSSRGCSYRR